MGLNGRQTDRQADCKTKKGCIRARDVRTDDEKVEHSGIGGQASRVDGRLFSQRDRWWGGGGGERGETEREMGAEREMGGGGGERQTDRQTETERQRET